MRGFCLARPEYGVMRLWLSTTAGAKPRDLLKRRELRWQGSSMLGQTRSFSPAYVTYSLAKRVLCLLRSPGDRVRIALKRPWSDGTTALELSAEELAERLVALVPPPRANQVLYGGVMTSRHRWHRAVRPRPPTRRAAPAGVGVRLTKTGSGSSRWTPWSLLLWRVFGVNGLACPTCGKVMVLRAAVRPPATLSVLASLERSARGPPAGTESAAGAERREPRSPEPECSGTGARRGLGAAQPAPTQARGVSEAGAVGENPGFPRVGAARARGGARLSQVGRPRVAVGWALG